MKLNPKFLGNFLILAILSCSCIFSGASNDSFFVSEEEYQRALNDASKLDPQMNQSDSYQNSSRPNFNDSRLQGGDVAKNQMMNSGFSGDVSGENPNFSGKNFPGSNSEMFNSNSYQQNDYRASVYAKEGAEAGNSSVNAESGQNQENKISENYQKGYGRQNQPYSAVGSNYYQNYQMRAPKLPTANYPPPNSNTPYPNGVRNPYPSNSYYDPYTAINPRYNPNFGARSEVQDPVIQLPRWQGEDFYYSQEDR